jgi:hypothetical protein
MAVVSDPVLVKLDEVMSRLAAIEKRLSSTYQLVASIVQQEAVIDMDLQDILTRVQAQTTVEDSIETLLVDLNTRLKAAIAANNPALIKQISDELDANTSRAVAAVVANTPAAPPVP